MKRADYSRKHTHTIKQNIVNQRNNFGEVLIAVTHIRSLVTAQSRPKQRDRPTRHLLATQPASSDLIPTPRPVTLPATRHLSKAIRVTHADADSFCSHDVNGSA